MTYLRDHGNKWHVIIVMILGIMPFGCSLPTGQHTNPEPSAASAGTNETATQSEKITFSLESKPGTKTRYRVTTKIVMTMKNQETEVKDNTSTSSFHELSESSKVVFTQEILGSVPEDPNTAIALVTIEQVSYNRTSPRQPDLIFNSLESTDQNSPFAKLIGQTYTIEIGPLGYVPGIFNLRPARVAVRGPSMAHAAALDLVDPSTIFLRHGFFSLPGPDIGSLSIGDQWRGVQQFTLKSSGTNIGRLGTYRFDKIYQLESVERRQMGTMAVVVFMGSPRSKRTPDGRPVSVPFLSCSYVGGGEFNLDAGRVESYLEQLEVRMPLPETGSPTVEDPEDQIVITTRFCQVKRLDLD